MTSRLVMSHPPRTVNDVLTVAAGTLGEPVRSLADQIERGDAHLGPRATAAIRRLARLPESRWTPAVRSAASQVLAVAGIPHPEVATADGDARQELRDAWRNSSDPTTRAGLVDGTWHIKAPRGSDPAVHAAALPDASYVEHLDAWRIPDPAWAAELIVTHRLYVRPDFDDTLDEALALPCPPNLTLSPDGGFLLRVRPSPGTASTLKSLVPSARWDSTEMVWRIPADGARTLADALATERWRVEPAAAEVIDATRAAWDQSLAASVALDAPDLVVPGLNPAIVLRPFQRAGIAYMAAKRRVFNCDSPGLGKTLMALSTFAVTGALPAIVVTKASLKSNWHRREIPKAFPGWTSTIVDGRTPKPIEPADVVVVNYDIVAARLDDLRAVEAKGIALDEGHYIKTATAARSKAIVELCREIGDRDGVVLDLTATPRPNRNYELWPQLRALGRDDLFGSSIQFAKRYCGAKEYRVRTKSGGTKTQLRVHEEPVPPERDLELNQILRANCMVVRHKNDVLTDLPPLELLPVVVDPDKKLAREYAKAEADIRSYAIERARQIALEEGEDPNRAMWRARLAVDSNPDLVELGNLRRIAESMKLPGVLDFTTGLITDNPIDPDTGKPTKVLLFVHFRDVQASYAEQTEPSLRKALNRTGIDLGLDDDTPAVAWLRSAADQKRADQDQIVDRFQSDPTLRILVCSASAIAEGITLTEATHVVLASPAWTWAQIEQQAGRAYGRLNDAHGISLWAPYVPETIDEAVLNIIERKQHESSRVVQGVPVGVDDEADTAAELFEAFATP